MRVQCSTKRARIIHRGFTLIELLVVISIIALLVSLLLPALSGARRTGQKIACQATLRQLAVAQQAYSTDYDETIIGAPSTSGSTLVRAPSSASPSGFQFSTAAGAATQRWDWMGPMAAQLGVPAHENSGALPDVIDRFNDLRRSPAFLCKSNNFLAAPFAGIPAGTDRMISYNTVRWQLFIRANSAKDAGFPMDAAGLSWYNNTFQDSILPMDWRPNVNRIGIPSNKVFLADGARYSDVITPPDYDMTLHATWGGTFADGGAWYNVSKSYDRSLAPGNFGGSPPGHSADARAYAYRHSTGAAMQGGAADSYKMNLVFYDGHAETQGDLQSTNPHQWFPKGSKINILSGIWNDTRAHFGYTGAFEIGP